MAKLTSLIYLFFDRTVTVIMVAYGLCSLIANMMIEVLANIPGNKNLQAIFEAPLYYFASSWTILAVYVAALALNPISPFWFTRPPVTRGVLVLPGTSL